MINIKPFGPSIGKVRMSKKFFDVLNKEFDDRSKSKKIDYSSKLASQIKNELKISNSFIKKNLEKEIKVNVIKFLTAGDKVKITLRYRGREMAHRELGIKILNNIKEETRQQAKVELEPKLEGRQAIMILAPEEKTAKEKINNK